MESTDLMERFFELKYRAPIRINYLGKTLEGHFKEWKKKSTPPNSFWLSIYLNLENYEKYLNAYLERRVITKEQLNKEIEGTKTIQDILVEIGSQSIEIEI